MTEFQREVRPELRTPDEVALEAAAAQARANGVRYGGEAGVAALKAHMRTLHRERKQGTGAGYGEEYFRGIMHGLTLMGAVDAEVTTQVHAWIGQWGYLAD